VAFAITEHTTESAQAFDAGSNFVLERPLSQTSVGRTLQAAYGLIVRERLRYFRCPASIPTAIRHDTKEIDCQALNISEGGMAITTPVPLKPGAQVHVKFSIPDREIEITAQSEICWSDEKGRAGLRFITTSPEQVPELRGGSRGCWKRVCLNRLPGNSSQLSSFNNFASTITDDSIRELEKPLGRDIVTVALPQNV
jgi:hypothetical protein